MADIIYEESLVGEEEELCHHHAQAEAGDGVAENHQRVLAQGEWRRNHVLVDLSIFVTMSSTAGSFSGFKTDSDSLWYISTSEN